MSTNYWPIHRSSIDQLSTIYRRSIGEVSAKCRWTKSCIGRDTSGTTIDRVLTEWRSTIDRLSTAISTECRPSVDRVSTECRPSVDRLSTECRPTIDRVSTAISTDISVDITHSKQDPTSILYCTICQLIQIRPNADGPCPWRLGDCAFGELFVMQDCLWFEVDYRK